MPVLPTVPPANNVPMHASREHHCSDELPTNQPDANLSLQDCHSSNKLPSSNNSLQTHHTNTMNPLAAAVKGTERMSHDRTPDTRPGNSANGSPSSLSCLSEDPTDFKQKLKDIEEMMFGNNIESLQGAVMEYPSFEPHNTTPPYVMLSGDYLKDLLVTCARALEENDAAVVEWTITQLQQMVSVSGEPLQRVGAYLLEGLIARLASSGSVICKSLKCKEPTSSELMSYMYILYEACPYFKFGYMSANGAIAEAMRSEDVIHIVDFQVAQGTQWIYLIQSLALKPGGPPRIRITGIDDSFNAHARGGGLHLVGRRLAQIAASCNVPFEFNPVSMPAEDIKEEHLQIRPGEALAVNIAFVLHHVPDESVSTANHRDRIIRMVKSLSPKIVTLVEQESNINTAPFVPRFVEAMEYYTAIFDSIDAKRPRDDRERISVEQHCLAREIVNIVACEGHERVERHELFGKWKARFTMAGFKPHGLSSIVNATIKSLLENYSGDYWIEERNGALFLGWKARPLVVSCAWS